MKNILLLVLSLMLFSCSYTRGYDLVEKTYCPVFPKIKKVVVLPYELEDRALHGGKRELEVQEGALEKLSTFTEDKLKELGCFDVITWEEVKNRLEQNGFIDRGDKTEKVFIMKIGEAFKADAVLKGYVLKYVDRVGGKYGVNKPASVSFNVLLYDVKDGSLLWSGAYSETQISLTENLFNIELFLKRGFKWLTADEIAKFGLGEVLTKIPGVSK